MKTLTFIKNFNWNGALCCVFFASVMLFCLFGHAIQAHSDTIQGKCIIVEQKDKQPKPELTGFTIKVEGKIYQIYRGPRGGMYYRKDGKKVYLTKKQKALIK